jgi:hypothetical protein
MWRSAAPTVSASSGGRLSERSHLAALNPERVRARRLAPKPAHQYRGHLVLHPGARADQLLAARQPPTHNAGALIGHPHRLEFPLPQPARERARVEPVGLRARLGDPRVIRADHDHPVHIRLEDPCGLPSSTAHLHRDPVRRHKARGSVSSASGVVATRPAERTTPSSQIATSQKSRSRSRPTARPTHLNNDCTASHLPTRLTERENQRANDTDRYVLAAQPGRVAGAATQQPRARSPSSKTACRPRSPKRPLSPTTRPYARGQTKPPANRFSRPDVRAWRLTIGGRSVPSAIGKRGRRRASRLRVVRAWHLLARSEPVADDAVQRAGRGERGGSRQPD